MSMRSIFSTIISGIYFVTNVAALHSSESNFWAERRRGIQSKSGSPVLVAGLPSAPTSVGTNFLQQFPSIDRHALAPSLSSTVAKSLPLNFTEKNASLLQALSTSCGSIRKITLPSSSHTLPPRTVIHIQDVHQNADAQKNIGQVVQSLVDHDQVGLVALEGAFHPINLSGFRSFSRQDVLKRWADYLLRTNRISGPIYSALTGAKVFPTIAGIDDPEHYNANVEAYRSSAPRIQEYKDKIVTLQSGLNNKKATLFNPALLTFDRSVQSYAAGKIGLGEHFKTLADQVPSNTLTQGAKDLLKALAMESTINFQQVEKERVEMVERLVQRLDKKKTDALIQWSAAYRAGQIRYAEFYKSLKDLCENNGLPLAHFPAMNEYIRYVLLADGIDPEQLLTDMTMLEKSAYARLIKTPEEKQLLDRSNALTLTDKLVDFSLTPMEYEEYTQVALPDFSKDELAMFQNFYQQAQARDQAMTENLVKSMTANNTNTAVLVTGGFHSPGMAKKLQRAGFTVISFTPKIEKIDASHGSAYLSVFSQEKTPLEKMFQGQKLFLAQNPAGGLNMAPAELPAGVAAADARNGASFSIIESDARDVLEELTRLGLSQGAISVPKVEVQVSGTQLHVNVEIVEEGNTRKVRYTVAFDEEGRYYKVDSAEVLDLNGRIVETAREYAPAAAREMLDRVNGLFNLGHSEAIAEIPIMSGLPGMTLAEIIWVLNLHRGRNVDPLDLATRIVKIELLRQLSLIAEAGRWVVNPTIAQGLLGSSLSVISEASRAEGRETEIAKAVAHYVLNYRSDGSSRPGLLNIDEWSVVFPSLDRSHMRNVILKRMLPQWLGRAPTEQEMDAVIAEALNRKINPAELLKQNWKQPDLIREWVQESQLATSGQGSFQGNDFPSLEQTRQMNFADKMRFIPLVFQEMARLALAGQWKIRKKPGIPLGQGEPVIDETKRQNWHDNYQKKASDLNLLLKFGLLPLDGENVEDWYERVAEIRAQIQQEAMGLHRNGDREGERALQNESRQIQEFVELLLADSHTPEGGFKEQNAQEIVLDFYHFESFYGHFLGVASGGTPAQIKEESLPSENGRIDNAVRPFSVADQSRSPYYRDSNIGVEVNDEGFISVENADLKKLPEGTIIHYAIAGGHWDYTLRVEKDGFVSIWLRADWGRILIPISQIGKVDFTVGSMNGTLDEESVARMPYFHQTPFGEGDRKLVSVGREAFDATPEDISILLPGGKTFREDAFIRKAEISKLAETIDEIESALVLEAIVPKNRARKIIQIRLMNEHGFSEEDVNQLMALAAKGTSPLQNEPAQAGRSDSELAQKIKALLEKRDAHSSSSGKPVRNTWFSSSVAGYGLFVVVAGVLMIFFGVDLETLSSPLKALLLMAAIPLSMVTTSTMGVAAFYEFSTRRKDPKAWVLKHGVKEGSAEYNAYMESADKIATAGRAATAAGKSAIWAEIKEQSRLNIQYFKVLLFRLGRTPQGPSTEEAPTAISTILQTMPDAKKGTFSAADVFGAVTNTGSDLQAVAKNAVQGMSDQTRGQVSEPASALRWLLKVAGIDTNAVALLPLPSTLLESGDLNQIVDNALAMHKNAVFYVEADVNIPTAFMKHLESKDHRADLVRLPGGVKLFDNQELRMAILEQNSPQNAPNVQPYLPDEYTANDTGVRDEKQFGKKSVLPMSLIIMFNRMIELANFIATQA